MFAGRWRVRWPCAVQLGSGDANQVRDLGSGYAGGPELAGQFILFLGEWGPSWLPAELVASGDSCGETFAGGFGAPGVSGVDKAVGDLPEQFSVFGGVE